MVTTPPINIAITHHTHTPSPLPTFNICNPKFFKTGLQFVRECHLASPCMRDCKNHAMGKINSAYSDGHKTTQLGSDIHDIYLMTGILLLPWDILTPNIL